MTTFARVAAIACLLAAAGSGYAEPQSSSSESAQDTGVPISRLVAIVAKKTGKRFVLDPRVHANVILVGQDPSDVSYSDLLMALKVYGFATVEDGGYVQITPDANARQLPGPIITSKDSRPAAETVTALITLKSISAPGLVPILRPLIPQQGNLSAFACTNTLIITDSFSNVRRIEGIIRALDTREPLPLQECGPQKPVPASN
jgi:general secretion pathway protein D